MIRTAHFTVDAKCEGFWVPKFSKQTAFATFRTVAIRQKEKVKYEFMSQIGGYTNGFPQ